MRIPEISNAALEKLERISNHPTISRGVQTVQISLKAYKSLLASNFRQFSLFHIQRLQENNQVLKDLYESYGDDSFEEIPNIRRIISAWTAFQNEGISIDLTERDVGYQALLKQCFEEYQQRYAEQQELLNSGAFISRVASALAKMPAAKELVFPESCYDMSLNDHDHQWFYGQQATADTMLRRFLLENWLLPSGHEPLTTHPVSLISTILAGLDTTDVNITSLFIELPSSHPDFAMLESTADKISSALRGLEVFELMNCFPQLLCGRRELEAFREFLGPIIRTERLEELWINLKLWGGEAEIDPASLPLVSVVKPKVAWPALSGLSLLRLRLQFSDFEHMLKSIRSGVPSVYIREVDLMDGSWAVILDILRDRHRGAWLQSPSGAECEAMSEQEYARIFGVYYDEEDEEDVEELEAHQYIRGSISTNPLLHPVSAESA